MLLLLAALVVASPQDLEPAPPSPYDRVLELEITADDEPLVDGRGPTVVAEYQVGFEGTLHVWTRSELDLFLRVERVPDGTVIDEDDDSGGGTTPYLGLGVAEGDSLAVLVASPSGTEVGRLELHLTAAPETEATRAAAETATEARKEIGRLRSQGELQAARELLIEAIDSLQATPGAQHSDRVSQAGWDLGWHADELMELSVDYAASSWAYRHRLRTLPEDHRQRLVAQRAFAGSLHAVGDYAGARALREAVLRSFERTLPELNGDVVRAKAELASSMSSVGEFAGARALQEAVVEVYEHNLPGDDVRLLRAKHSLASTMAAMGDLAAARALRQAVLAGFERTLPEGHPELLPARSGLADSMMTMGDFAGARALIEAVLAGYEPTLPPDHPVLLRCRGNLARAMFGMGDFAGARALLESVVAACERTLPEDHLSLLIKKHGLAVSMARMGEVAESRALMEAVVAGYERTLPEDHPNLLSARGGLANTMREMGDVAESRALQEAVVAGYDRTLPEDHPDRLWAEANLAGLLHELGDVAGARALIPSLTGGMRARVLASLAGAPRQALGTVAQEDYRLSSVVFLSESGEPPLHRDVFELTETLRLVGGEAARSLARFERDPELAPILAEAASVRSRLNDLVAGSARDASDLDVAEELTRLTLERDALESEASRKLAERGVVVRALDSEALAAALDAGEVAVGYRRVRHWEGGEPVGDRMIAHVLTSTGALARVDLGPANELEELASDWRAALGASLLRGVALTGEERSEPEAGRALRARLLDPVLAAAGGEVARLYVCADDLVFLVPLDALSLEDEAERVGDRWQIVSEVSFARLLSPGATPDAAPSLLALGGVDYDAVGSTPAGLSGSSAPIEEGDEVGAGSESATSRSAPTDHFQSLLQSRLEAEATGILFQDAFELDPVLLTKKGTTKAALFEAAPGTRYLHIATHGWFAPESVKSILDASPAYSLRMTLEERITGLAPMTLCGLALAGANRGRDSLGRVPGILTAEELCSLDLSQCELAVLSACETNVGIRRAGQGIQSLQAALYAAGARSSITSLWKVDDAATRRLFEIFYTVLWKEKLGVADALWEAKRALRSEGHPVGDWAAWVLTGDPD